MVFNTIIESGEMHLLVFVEKKAATTVNQIFEVKISEAFPASVLKEHPNVIAIDEKLRLEELP